jgi:hypothetical protein
LARDFWRRLALDHFLVSLNVRDLSAWAVPNGRLYRRFSAWGFAISCVRDLRPEIADYDIDGEVTMLVPRVKSTVTLRQSDFTLTLRYELWDFHSILSPLQQARAGGATELHLKADVDPSDLFLLWLEEAFPQTQPAWQ